MWKIINKLTDKKSKTTKITELKVNGESITKQDSIADALNTYFNEIGPYLASNLPDSNTIPENYISPCDTSFEFSEILPLDVHRILSMPKTSKATGHDRISPKLLKYCADIVAKSLTVIFIKSIEMGVFPDDFKVACVSPIHKSGSKSESSNYRPISVLTIISKTFEKLISKQLTVYLESNKLPSVYQAGFRKKSSTQTSLLHITKWYMNMDKGRLNGIILLDLKQAFDCVDHGIQLGKMAHFGIRGTTLNLFQSNIIQMCKVDQTISKEKIIRCDVRQGSNLGPLLFLMCTLQKLLCNINTKLCVNIASTVTHRFV